MKIHLVATFILVLMSDGAFAQAENHPQPPAATQAQPPVAPQDQAADPKFAECVKKFSDNAGRFTEKFAEEFCKDGPVIDPEKNIFTYQPPPLDFDAFRAPRTEGQI